MVARALADDPDEVDRRFRKPFPLTVPDHDPESGYPEFALRTWQILALEQIRRNQRGQILMQADAGKKTLMVKICHYAPKPVEHWPDFRILVVAREMAVVREIWRECIGHGLNAGLLHARSTGEDERARIVCSTAASLVKVGRTDFDALLAYEPYDLMTPATYETLLALRVHRAYGFGNVDYVPKHDDPERIKELEFFFGPVLLSRSFPGLVPPDLQQDRSQP